jgi:hypothetical protein
MHHIVDLSLAGSVAIDGIVGSSTCRLLNDGTYRCGVRFRTETRAQLDRDQIREALLRLESLMAPEPLADVSIST